MLIFDTGTAPNGYTTVTQCMDGSFCCTKSNTTCCTNKSGIYLSSDGRQFLSSNIAQTSNTSYTQASNTSCAHASNTSCIQASNAPCMSLRAGTGAASAVAGILLIFLIVIVFHYRKTRHPSHLSPTAEPNTSNIPGEYGGIWNPAAQLGISQSPYELADSPFPNRYAKR